MNTSCGRCGDTVKCRLEAPYFDRKVRVRIYTYRSRNGLGISYVYMGHFHKKGQITVKTWRSIFNPVGTRYLCISIDICMPFDTYVL